MLTLPACRENLPSLFEAECQDHIAFGGYAGCQIDELDRAMAASSRASAARLILAEASIDPRQSGVTFLCVAHKSLSRGSIELQFSPGLSFFSIRCPARTSIPSFP